MKTKMLLGVAFAALTSAPTYAQTAGSSDAATANEGERNEDVVVVTANRREQSLQEVSLALTVVSGDDLEDAGVSQATDLQQIVPGLTISAGGAAVQTYLRGVGSFATDVSAESAIAYNIDGVYISRPNGIGPIFFDLDRVEVLKGPQGTLYGRNASGGAINLITRQPTQELEAYGSVEVGNYNHVKTTAAVGGGLTDTLSVRAAMQFIDRDGYLSDGYQDEESIAGRLTALWEPTDAVSLRIMGEYTDLGGKGRGPVKRSTLTSTPDDPWEGPSVGFTQQPPTAFIPGGTAITDEGEQDINVYAVSATLNVDFGPAVMTFIPAYRETRADYLTFTPGFYFDTAETSKQQSYELRFANTSERVDWVIGGYYFNEDQTQIYELQAIPIQNSIVNTPLHTESFAVFGEATVSLTDSFRVIGGARYSKDKKRQEGFTQGILPVPTLVDNSGERSFEDVSWKAGIEYDLTDDTFLFATASTGYKSGGFFPSVPAPDNSFEPEELRAVTVGARNNLLGGALQLNLEGFYWKYRNKQERFLGASPSGSTGLLTTNAGEATLYGVNVEAVYKPTENDTLRLSTEYLHSEYDSFVYDVYNPSVGPFINSYPPNATGCALGAAVPYTANDFIPVLLGDSTQTIDCSGMALVRAPKWTGSAGYEHVFELGGDREIIVGVDGLYSSKQYLTPDFIEAGSDDGHFTLNADITFDLGNGVTLRGWARNLTEEAVYTGGFRFPFSRPAVAGGDPTLFYAAISPPRTYGVTLKFEY